MKKKRRRILLGFLLVLLALAVFDYWTFPLLTRTPSTGFDQGRNGIWLRYPWFFGEHSLGEVQALAKRLKADGFHYAYFHVRDMKPDGSLRYPHYKQGKELNQILERAEPGIARIAWIYVGNRRGQGAIELNRPEVRKRMIAEAGRLIRECGFQGIQWDYEICDDGDPHLLALLEESRQAFPKGTWLGAAVPTWFSWPISGFGWSEAYFRKVAERCDQLAVMTYDTAMYHPRIYSWLVAQQVAVVGRATQKTTCRFVIGVPTYPEGTLSHNPRAENLAIAVRAVRSALDESRPARFEGIALFAEYTTTPPDWHFFRTEWR